MIFLKGAGQDLVRDPFGGNVHFAKWPLMTIIL
jgi:fructose 1,6-bisphosphatase